jgi:hypothetical protein
MNTNTNTNPRTSSDTTHDRGHLLRDVVATADARRDGRLPWDVPGLSEAFEDELSLLGALQLRWHTRLAGRIERELLRRPAEPGTAVVTAWHATADELSGVRAILDRYHAHPSDEAMARALAKAAAKEHALLAAMAGRAGVADPGAARIGAAIEREARASYRPAATPVREGRADHRTARPTLLGRLKAVLAA